MEMPTKLEQFLIEGLLKMELQPSESYFFEVYIHILEQMALIDDNYTQKRVNVYLCRYKNWLIFTYVQLGMHWWGIKLS